MTAYPHQNSASTVVAVKSFSLSPGRYKEVPNSGRYLLPRRKLRSTEVPKPARTHKSTSFYVGNGPCDIGYRQILESRPPLYPDLSTPGPWTYEIHSKKPLKETNAPSFTMRPKCWPEKTLGGRTSWSKTWYQSPDVWTTKANFHDDSVWPNPHTYDEKLSLGGKHQPTLHRSPDFSMRKKSHTSFIRSGTEDEPSPNSYDKERADGQIYYRSPTIIHSFRPKNANLWGPSECTPGPGTYTPNLHLVTRHQPAFSVSRASREGTDPLLGPYATH